MKAGKYTELYFFHVIIQMINAPLILPMPIQMRNELLLLLPLPLPLQQHTWNHELYVLIPLFPLLSVVLASDHNEQKIPIGNSHQKNETKQGQNYN